MKNFVFIFTFCLYGACYAQYFPAFQNEFFFGRMPVVKIDKHTLAETTVSNFGLALSLLPSYIYASSLTDGAYGTASIRATYMPVLATKIKHANNTPEWKTLTVHRVEAGGHFDFHYERTVSLVTNGFFVRTWSKDETLFREGSNDWKPNGDVYFGTTYYLRRLKL
ncbi:MAG: hypothetical protein R3D00_29765 [Bacteroidia bacterium]